MAYRLLAFLWFCVALQQMFYVKNSEIAFFALSVAGLMLLAEIESHLRKK